MKTPKEITEIFLTMTPSTTSDLAPIKKLSSILVTKFNGKVPNNLIDLEALPGVGHKTASVVMSQGFGVPAFAVDTNIYRLAKR